jgi:predicted Fe-S protein YdhL (DUF1289 family)
MANVTNDVWERPVPEPKSPCQNQCVVSSVTGFCECCFMTLKEIVEWDASTNSEKELIVNNCKKRVKI